MHSYDPTAADEDDPRTNGGIDTIVVHDRGAQQTNFCDPAQSTLHDWKSPVGASCHRITIRTFGLGVKFAVESVAQPQADAAELHPLDNPAQNDDCP
ncbi:hypothetical protein J53TS2_14690 [Paenibacillus sp. J53TS2]|nr:hypothetical protein J53TS2_14690 [Paenibacillus sp. J53TS2]